MLSSARPWMRPERSQSDSHTSFAVPLKYGRKGARLLPYMGTLFRRCAVVRNSLHDVSEVLSSDLAPLRGRHPRKSRVF